MSVEEYQAIQDGDNLRILAILKTIYGILIFVGSIFVILYFGFFVTMMTMASSSKPIPGAPNAATPDPFPGAIVPIFVAAGIVALLVVWAMGFLALYSGKCIRERRNWTLVMVSACINCLHMPLGTALGVCTIIVINKPSVKAAFDRTAHY